MRRRFKSLLAEFLVVTMEDDTTISGVLWSETGTLLVLRNATFHPVSGPAVPVDGEAILLVEHISFIQRPVTGGK